MTIIVIIVEVWIGVSIILLLGAVLLEFWLRPSAGEQRAGGWT